jgi:hypothetical protein
MTTRRPPIEADKELGLRNAGWTVSLTDRLLHLAEVNEFVETAANEVEGIRLRLFDLANAVAKAALHELVDLSDEMMVLFRKLTNLEEQIVELTGHRPAQGIEFDDEVDQ